MFQINWSFRWVLVITLLPLMLCGCKQDEHMPADTVRVVYIPFSTSLPFFVALEKGYFDEEGVKVLPTRAEGSSEAINMLLTGKVDISIENNMGGVLAAAGRSPGSLRLFMPCVETNEKYYDYLLVPGNSSVKSVEDLKGKRVCIRQGPSDFVIGSLFFKKLGIDPEKDILMIQMHPKQQLDALKMGQVDAVLTVDPDATVTIERLGARLLLPFYRGKVFNPYPSTSNSVTTKFWEQHPSAVRKFATALKRAVRDIEKDPVAAKRILPKFTAIDVDIADKINIPEFAIDPGPLLHKIQVVADTYYAHGLNPVKVDVMDLFLTAKDLGVQEVLSQNQN